MKLFNFVINQPLFIPKTMKKILLAMCSALMLMAFGGQSEKKTNEKAVKDFATLQIEKYKGYGITGLVIDSLQFVVKSKVKIDPKAFEGEEAVGLNDLRFYGWTGETWGNNNYIRTIRIFMDGIVAGEVSEKLVKGVTFPAENELPFDKYKGFMGSKFVLVEIEPFSGGGILCRIIPLDNTKLIITAWVYSPVVEGCITGYDLRMFYVIEASKELISKEEVEMLRKGKMDCIVW